MWSPPRDVVHSENQGRGGRGHQDAGLVAPWRDARPRHARSRRSMRRANRCGPFRRAVTCTQRTVPVRQEDPVALVEDATTGHDGLHLRHHLVFVFRMEQADEFLPRERFREPQAIRFAGPPPSPRQRRS